MNQYENEEELLLHRFSRTEWTSMNEDEQRNFKTTDNFKREETGTIHYETSKTNLINLT